MRDRIVVPVDKLHPSATLGYDQLALVETLGIGAHAVSRGAVASGERVLVIGAGPIGLSVVQFAQLAGAEVTVCDVSDDRLAFCRDQFNIARTIDVRADAFERVRAAFDNDLPPVVFDATGNATSMHSAFQYVAHHGRLVFVGLFMGDVSFHDPDFHRRELTLLATRNALPDDLQRVVDGMESGAIDTAPWLTHRAGYDDLVEAFPSWLEPETRVVKAILEF